MSQRGCLVILSEPARREPLREDDLARGYVIGRGPDAEGEENGERPSVEVWAWKGHAFRRTE